MRTLRRSVPTLVFAATFALPTGAAAAAEARDQLSYTSQPDRLAIFLNDIAYAQDVVTLPGDVGARIILPDTVLADTLILREDGERVGSYRIDRRSGPPTVHWQGESDAAVREISIEYLLGGVSWRPTYDLWLGEDSDRTVELDFLAEIRDGSLILDGVQTRLVAGVVDATSPLPQAAGEFRFDDDYGSFDGSGVRAIPTGEATIQHVYAIGSVTAMPGDTAYLKMLGDTFDARRRHIWDARIDENVDVIYEIANDSELPFAAGIVRTYQADMYVGSDGIEATPTGSDGSVNVGHLQDVRVERTETRTAIEIDRFDYHHEVQLAVSNFGPTTLIIEVVDGRRPEAEVLRFAQSPEQESGNVLRWEIEVEPGATEIITYSYRVD